MHESAQFTFFSNANTSSHNHTGHHFTTGQIIEISLAALTTAVIISAFVLACALYILECCIPARKHKDALLTERTPLHMP